MVNNKLEIFIIVSVLSAVILCLHYSILASEKEKYIDGMNEFADYWCKTQPSEYDIVRGYYNESVCVENQTRIYTHHEIRVYDIKTNHTIYETTFYFDHFIVGNHTDFEAHIAGQWYNDEDRAKRAMADYFFEISRAYDPIFDYDLYVFNYSRKYCNKYLRVPDNIVAKSYFEGGIFDEDYKLNKHLSVTNAFVCFDGDIEVYNYG